jgi:asparagine synthase (glutamine-hydrolysing)
MPERTLGRNFINRADKPVENFFLGSSFVYGGFSEQEKLDQYTPDFAEHQSDYNSHEVIKRTLNGLTNVSKLHKMMYVDTKHWLADSHLIMMDKMSMAHSMELRTPLLDHRLVELAASLPENFKLDLSRSKLIFKDAFQSEIPSKILKRAKRGFSTPLNTWFQNFDDELADILIHQKSLVKDIFKKEEIKKMLSKHKQGKADYSANIFTLLILNFWSKVFVSS